MSSHASKGDAHASNKQSLLLMLMNAHVDDERSLMHECTLACCVKALGRLSAVSRWHYEHCRKRLHNLRDQHVMQEQELASWLGYLYHERAAQWQLLANVRALTIPDTLPPALRPLLGVWLRAEGRLARVSCVRCRSWIKTGEIIGWVEMESVRSGEPERMSPEERFALDRLDTPDGLLKTVLKHARNESCS